MAKYLDMSADVTIKLPVTLIVGNTAPPAEAEEVEENEEVKENGNS